MNVKLNRSDYLLLAIYYSVSVLMAIYEYVKQNEDLIEYLLDIPSFVIVDIFVIYLFLNWLLPNYVIYQKKYFQFTFWALLVLILAGFWEDIVGYYSGGNDWSKFRYGFQRVIDYISNTAQSVGLPFGLLLAKKYYEEQVLISSIKEKQKENELKLLRSQISPHFLFNNLNTLDALIDSDTEKAKKYINRLSLIYRYLIQTKDAEVMELTEEMNFAENYMFLIKTRFGDDYEFTITKNVSLENKFVPTGAIQTLLENIAKHNRAQHGKTIKAELTIDEDWLTLSNTKSVIKNTYESFGTGLQNLANRYTLLSDKKPIVEDSSEKFTIKIPVIKLSNES